jgi:putative endonuclease
LYTGVTNDLAARLIEHWLNRNCHGSFAGKYFCCNLLYYENFNNVELAISREKQIKGWVRAKKFALIETSNPDWTFLNESVCGKWPPFDFIQRY